MPLGYMSIYVVYPHNQILYLGISLATMCQRRWAYLYIDTYSASVEEELNYWPFFSLSLSKDSWIAFTSAN